MSMKWRIEPGVYEWAEHKLPPRRWREGMVKRAAETERVPVKRAVLVDRSRYTGAILRQLESQYGIGRKSRINKRQGEAGA